RSTMGAAMWGLTVLTVSGMLVSSMLVSDDDDATTSTVTALVPASAPASVEPNVQPNLEPKVELARGPGRERPGTGARIWIAADALRFADASGQASQLVASLDDGRIPETKNHVVRPLHELLDDDSRPRPSPHDALTLFVDRRVPWTTIVDVLYTTGRAGWSRWDFVVETDGEDRVLTARPAMYSMLEIELAQLAMLQLWVTPEQVEVSTQIARPMSTEPGLVRALDVGDGSCGLGRDRLDSLRSLSERLCELSGVAIPVWVAAEPQIRWAEVVEVLGHALTEGICDGGIVVSTDTRPGNCDTPTRLDALAELLAR
ncbi:MAG TPA: hypothetical protein VK034_16710, partial [Enhygromyxa sp.]|nr:hypothetical protein [Enhygromyxa sp.]